VQRAATVRNAVAACSAAVIRNVAATWSAAATRNAAATCNATAACNAVVTCKLARQRRYGTIGACKVATLWRCWSLQGNDTMTLHNVRCSSRRGSDGRRCLAALQ
jgi:hypothetical protein